MSSSRERIITKLDVRTAIDPAGELAQGAGFLKTYLAKAGARGYVLGISGGQDSLLAGYRRAAS